MTTSLSLRVATSRTSIVQTAHPMRRPRKHAVPVEVRRRVVQAQPANGAGGIAAGAVVLAVVPAAAEAAVRSKQ